MNQITEVLEWFNLAVPSPNERNFWIQAGCDAEECAEALEALGLEEEARLLDNVAYDMKISPELFTLEEVDRTALLDAICDRIVTGIGMAHMLGMDIQGALAEVNRSNWSKFVGGKPVFDENGKIKKGPGYSAPELGRFIGGVA